MALVRIAIFVKAPIEASTQNVTVMCECVIFFVSLTFIFTVVPFQIQHKLNYFLICEIFWILIVSYDENLKNSCSQPLV